MAETKTYQGHVYTRNSPGEPWVLSVQPTGRGMVVTDPFKANDERRKDEDQRFEQERLAMERERLRIAEDTARLARERADLDRGKAGREAATSAARGGVETTESERTAAFLATRVAGGIQDLKNIGKVGAPTLKDAVVGGTLLGNYTTDESRQRTINAQRDILDAALTLGTGAAYTKEQIEAYRASYFPQPGDEPGTVKDKQVRLQRLLEAGKLKAGASAGMIDQALANVAPAPTRGETVNYSQELPGGLTGSVTDDSQPVASAGGGGPPQQPASPAAPWGESLASQGLSGINEGIAGTLGAPVDLLTSGINLIPQGINAVANTNIPQISDPVGGSDWFRDLLAPTIGAESSDPTNQFVRRAGQSVGSALVPIGATAGSAKSAGAQILSALGGGMGAATAQQVAPGNVLAEMGGEMLGSMVPGAAFAKAGQMSRQREIEDAVLTVDELKDQAGQLYRQAEARGITADPMLTQQLADDFRRTLTSEGHVSPTGRISEVYPKTREAMQLVDDYSGMPMSPTQMQTVRKIVTDGMKSQDGSERRVASLLTDAFDDWAAPLAPELPAARAVASRYLTAEQLEQARELAGARAGQFTGSGFENALRTEYRGLDRANIKGSKRFSNDVGGAIEDVSRGTTGSNIARALGRFAPTGPVSAGLGIGAPVAAGAAIAGPVGAAVAGTTAAALGTGGRIAATRMGIRNADIAELIARNGGAIDQAPLVDDGTRRAIAALLAAQQTQYLE